MDAPVGRGMQAPDFGDGRPDGEAERRDRRRVGVLLVALGFIVPIATGTLFNLGLMSGITDVLSRSALLMLAFLGIVAGIVTTVAGLMLLVKNRDPRADAGAVRRDEQEIDAALDEAIEDMEEHEGEPSILLDAPTGLPWEKR